MVKHIFDQLSQTTKRTEKINILKKYKDDTTLQSVLVAALDPYATYNIKKIPDHTPSTVGNVSISQFVESLAKLSSRDVTGNMAIEYLRDLLSNMSSDDADIAIRIIKKDLRCGVQDATVNSVWDKLIPSYPCLLARPYNEQSISNISWPAYSQLKADGMRCNVLYNHKAKSIEFRGRSGKLIDLLGYYDSEFIDLCDLFGTSVVLDGELVVCDLDKNVLSRKEGNGILNKAIKGTISQAEVQMVKMRIWDVIPMSEFKLMVSTQPYKDRFKTLTDYVAMKPADVYSIIATKEVSSLDEAWDHYNEMISSGEEGTILKNTDHLWEDKRSSGLVKLKSEKVCELRVIGWNPGTPGTKNDGKVGSLICASEDGKVEVSISGFTDQVRDEITANINDYISKIVSVMYNDRITSKDKSRVDVDSLFLPRWVEFREDKYLADMSEDIK